VYTHIVWPIFNAFLCNTQVWFRENWYEEVLRLLRQGLAKCYAIAFENRGAVCDAVITPHTLNFVKKLVSTFGLGIGEHAKEKPFVIEN
jgi:transformation/transcription domain-associated protein